MEKLLEQVIKFYQEAQKAALDAAKASDEQRELSLKNEGALFAYSKVAEIVSQNVATEKANVEPVEPSKEAIDVTPDAK